MKFAPKVCPIVLRRKDDRVEILAFRHPVAGLQLVKGSPLHGEDLAQGALRELREESGLCDTEIVEPLGVVRVTGPDQEWHLFTCATGVLPESWSHFTDDGGGHEFQFFWHPLDQEPDNDWHPIFKQALSFVRAAAKRRRL